MAPSTTMNPFMILTAIFTLIAVWGVAVGSMESDQVVGAQSTNLLQVQMLFRHGARSPVSTYPTSPNPPEVWPEGPGTLTKIGKKQHYTLGKYLRNFYTGFVTSNPNEVFVNSSYYKRCLQSALSNLAAFYAPSEEWVVEDGLNWQPVPVHYIDEKYDKYLALDAGCPKLQEEQVKQFNSSEFLSEFEKHHDLFEVMKLLGGLTSTEIFDVYMFQDAIFTEKYHGLLVPDWIEPYWEELNDIGDYIFHVTTNTYIQRRLKTGPFLGKMLENMDNKIAGKDGHIKVHMFAAHDGNLYSVLESLGLYERRPPFAACLLVELHETLDGPAVRLMYLNSTTMQDISTISPHVLKLQGCGEFCPLEHFRSIAQVFIPEDWHGECHNTTTV